MKITIFEIDRLVKLVWLGLFLFVLFASFHTISDAQVSGRSIPIIFHGKGERALGIRACYNRSLAAVRALGNHRKLGSAYSTNDSYIEVSVGTSTVLISCPYTTRSQSWVYPLIIVASNNRSNSVGEALWRRVVRAMNSAGSSGSAGNTGRTNNTRRAANSTAINWNATATSKRGRNGQRFRYYCSPNGSLGRAVWGTTLYTDDSSICAAAVHAGVIRRNAGGNVTIEIRPGRASYVGATRNGITSRGYGRWTGSYVFVRN